MWKNQNELAVAITGMIVLGLPVLAWAAEPGPEDMLWGGWGMLLFGSVIIFGILAGLVIGAVLLLRRYVENVSVKAEQASKATASTPPDSPGEPSDQGDIDKDEAEKKNHSPGD